MYTFSNRLKIFSIALMILGAIGWGYSYMQSHNTTVEDVKVLLAEEASGHHGGGHGEAASHGDSAEEHHDDEHAERQEEGDGKHE